MLHDYLTSNIRTYVPIGAGFLISFLASKGVELDPDTRTLVTAAMTALAIGLYYSLARLIEMKWPSAGRWLLGSTKQPQYQGANVPGGAGIQPELTIGDNDK